jgi:hypothetical protein
MCGECKRNEIKANKSEYDAFASLHKANKNLSERHGKLFTLDLEDSIKIYKSNCYYCNIKPSNIFKGIYKYSGVDRIDSTRGYEKDNTRACCFNCNRAKSNLPEGVFLKLISDIFTNRVQRLSEESE